MTWTSRTTNIKVGDRVAYSARFLRAISCHTGAMPHARGTVEAIGRFGEITVALISWDGSPEDLPDKVAAANLSRVTQRGVMDHD